MPRRFLQQNPEETIWYDVGEAPVGDDGSFVTTFTVPAEAKDIGVQKVIAGTAEVSWQTDAVFHVVTDPEEEPPRHSIHR